MWWAARVYLCAYLSMRRQRWRRRRWLWDRQTTATTRWFMRARGVFALKMKQNLMNNVTPRLLRINNIFWITFNRTSNANAIYSPKAFSEAFYGVAKVLSLSSLARSHTRTLLDGKSFVRGACKMKCDTRISAIYCGGFRHHRQENFIGCQKWFQISYTVFTLFIFRSTRKPNFPSSNAVKYLEQR